jgi:hypothetical protein
MLQVSNNIIVPTPHKRLFHCIDPPFSPTRTHASLTSPITSPTLTRGTTITHPVTNHNEFPSQVNASPIVHRHVSLSVSSPKQNLTGCIENHMNSYVAQNCGSGSNQNTVINSCDIMPVMDQKSFFSSPVKEISNPGCSVNQSCEAKSMENNENSDSDNDSDSDSTMRDSPDIKKRRTVEYRNPESRPSSPTSRKFLTDTDFTTSWSIYSVNEEMFLQWIPKRRRMKYQSGKTEDEIFSTEDVKFMLATALEETRRQLDDEFQKVLSKKLKDQIDDLSSVVNDTVHRQLEMSSHDYMI